MATANPPSGTFRPKGFTLSQVSENFLFNLSVKTANGLTSRGGAITALIVGMLLMMYSVLDTYRASL